MIKKSEPSGFAVVGVIAIALAVAGISFAGWRVLANKDDEKTTKSNSTNPAQQTNNNTQQPRDQYEGWKSYTNAPYGINLRYPSDWKLDEAPSNSLSSATKQEYEIDLKRNEELKYSGTITIEVLGEEINMAIAWYDNNQSSSSKIAKTTNQIKGKQSAQYVISNSGATTKRYLFAVGNKTYSFSSINEELNTQTDTSYWTKFDKVFDSLQID